MFSYQLSRSARRKSLAITVKEGQVFVRAPARLPQSQIDQFINQKVHWIAQKLKQSVLNAVIANQAFDQGSSILIGGNTYEIAYQADEHQAVHIKEDTCYVPIDTRATPEVMRETCRQQLLDYYLKAAKADIPARLAFWIERTQLHPSGFKTRFYKSRWGSCNSKGQLTFNSLLTMMPERVIDYVIVHELCHLVHMNHSADFWSLVERFMPEYQACKQWINQHQQPLNVFR